ncbi:MAG: hypothetical protein Q9169_002810 [Polycauliona sp. 2 TL-2023]
MKQLYSLLYVLSFLQFLSPSLAATRIQSPNDVLVRPKLLGNPPSDEKIKVYGTTVQVLFKDYLPVRRVDEERYLHIAHNVLYDIIKSLSAAPADDHRVHAPNLGPWRWGSVYVTMHNPELEMTWEIFAHAMRGMLDFFDNWGMMLARGLIVDDNLGFVGEIRVGRGFWDAGNATAVESGNVNETA